MKRFDQCTTSCTTDCGHCKGRRFGPHSLIVRGAYVSYRGGARSKVVGFRAKVKGSISEVPDKYVVCVEQSGDYRMYTTRVTAVTVVE